MNKILSIIVPSYNMEAYLPKCLGSLVINDKKLRQKLDVIVVNDGSKDRTSEIAHEFEAKYPSVFRVIDKENGHYGSCINAALPVAAGLYIKILDADDSFNTAEFSDYLRTMTDLSEPVDLILNDFEYCYEDSESGSRGALGLKPGRCTLADVVKGFHFGMHSIAYRTQILRDVNYRQTEKMLYTDIDWNTLPMRNVQTVYVIDKVVYRYLQGRAGQSVSVQGKNVEMLKALVSRAHKWFLQSSGCPEAYVERTRRAFVATSADLIRTLMFCCPYSIVNDALASVDSAIRSAGVNDDMAYDRLSLLSRSSHPYRYFRAWQKRGRMSFVKIWAIRRLAALIRFVHRRIRS